MRYVTESSGNRWYDAWGRWRNKSISPHVVARTLVLFFLLPSSVYGQQQDLLQLATESGTVRVLVQMRQERFVPEGALGSASAIHAQRQAIRQVQDRVLDRAAAFGATGVKRFQSIFFVAMEIDASGLSDLLSNPDVESVVQDVPVRLGNPFLAGLAVVVLDDVAPNRPALNDSTIVIGADQAWAAGYTGAGLAVAVLDTGVETTHQFLAGKLVSEACYSSTVSGYSSTLCPDGAESSTSPGSGYNCDASIPSCDHGTHVAGIAVGNGPTFSGVGKGANLIAIQVFSRFDNTDFCGECCTPCLASWSSDQILALERVLELSATIDIASVNMSLGGGGYTSTSACDAANLAKKAAIDNLRSAGIATVIAAGNSWYTDALSAPGCISTAVSVGSTSKQDVISYFSNEATFLSLYAPGQSIQSSVLFDGFGFKSGTSMAAPHVAGAWTILKEQMPTDTVGTLLDTAQNAGLLITSSDGTWATSRIALDPLEAPNPLMRVEQPFAVSVQRWPFQISGWAIDLGALTGAGVDAVHVWAFPNGSGNDFGQATFLGQATLGFSRPDVASYFGDPELELSGFELDSNKLLAPGGYTFKVFARSTITGTFNNEREVPVTVKDLTKIHVEKPGNGDVVGAPFDVGGWAFNTGTPAGVGIDAIHVWAYPARGSGIFLGEATLGISRSDVASFVGMSEFDTSGFRLMVTRPLPVGADTLRIYVRNSATGRFDTFSERSVTAASTDPRMNLETPAVGATVATPFTVSGWALDLAASMGSGVDSVHVWAFPTNGSPGTFLGLATLGISRPDVASFFGMPAEFELSGVNLNVTTPLASGTYMLTIFGHSTVTGTFNNSSSRSIIVP